ncbi:MAG: starch-binding protein [Bacteroides sp.]|nr:starch-binding protein [Bacteroides sp.]
MRKNIYNLLFMLMPFLALTLNSCDDDEIVFDHELPQFELRDDAILLEVIMPQGTAADETIFIAGEFNGGEEVASEDLRWQLEKAANSDVKWGIYLNPADFVSGKTLADGFYFVSKKQGIERTVKDEESIHTLNVGVGTRTNIYVNRWAAYFDVPEDPSQVTHDGHAIFVVDNTGWEELTLYAWGTDLPELFGSWPGAQPTGTVDIKGVTYKYFDTGAANEGLTYNFIFNNNGAGSQFDAMQGFVLDRDIYIEITADGYTEVDPNAVVTHDGYAIFIEDGSGWDELTMYAWGTDLPELLGAWPGALPTGEVTIQGKTYKYFDTGEANKGLTYNLIMNNNGAGSQFDLAQVTLDRDYYFSITNAAGTEVDPNNPGETPEPEPTPEPADYSIFVKDKTGWDAVTLYAWGDKEMFGGWPGAAPTKVTINGEAYLCFAVKGAVGEALNLIFNNNGAGSQLADFAIKAERDYYLEITAEGCKEIERPATCKIYVDDTTGWEAISLYAWGDVEKFGGWPGTVFSATETIGEKTYKVISAAAAGETLNLIFNSNGAGSQLADFPIKFNRDYYLTVAANGCTEIAN